MTSPRCPGCRLVMFVSDGGHECPACGHYEPAQTVADVITETLPTDKISAWAAMTRAVVDNLPDL